MGVDVENTPRGGRTYPASNNYPFDNNCNENDPIDDPSRCSIDDSSRSSSKASLNDSGAKPQKPRRPTNYAERKSSISKRPSSISAPIKTLTLNHTVLASPMTSKLSVPSPPVSAKSISKVAFTPILEHSQPLRHIPKLGNGSRSEPADGGSEATEIPYLTITPPSRPDKEVAKSPATRMYWHQPPTHGMMATGPARRSHSIAQIGPTIFLFGGSDGLPPKATNTIYIFDTDTALWRIPKVSGTLPPPLRAHTTTAYRQKIYLFGGGTGNEEYYNHVYMFSAQTYRWSQILESIRGDSALPVPRRAHTSVLFDSGIYIFGGGSGSSGLNDLWRLDLNTHRWTEITPTGRKPEPRVYHTATVVRDVMIIYGGLDGKQCFSNIFLYNFLANTYTEVIVPFGPRLCRISHTTTCVGSQLFVFGGSNGSQFNNELWIFDLTSKTWSMRECSGTLPAARGYHTTAFYDARLWVFGGMDTLREGFNDVHCLEFGGSGYLGSVYVDHVR